MRFRVPMILAIVIFLAGSLWLTPRFQDNRIISAEKKKTQVSLVYSEKYTIQLGGIEKLHSFDIHKYKRIHDQLLADKIADLLLVEQPEEISEKEILHVHTKSYLESLKDSSEIATYLEAPLISFISVPVIDKNVLKPFRYATGGTLLASRRALENGIGINLAGGYHHAKPDKGEGFCIYADIPIAIRVLQAEGKIKRALVIDLDVHQGNGTAVCLAEDDSTYCFSIHQGDIYPFPKEESDLDVEITAGTDDKKYLEILETHLPKVFKAANKPDIVFYVAGCDTFKGDPLASVNMTEAGIVKRDSMVINACVDRNIPVVMTLSGGYSKNAWHTQYSSIKAILQKYGQANQPNQ